MGSISKWFEGLLAPNGNIYGYPILHRIRVSKQ